MISDTAESITDAAGSAWDGFLRKISELTDETGRRMTEQQTKARLDSINDAVGRPVTKVILDRSDDVILNLGDIITHEAVQRAYDAGTLDTLLGSVYKGEVAFERDEMKAPGKGTSTVEKASGGAAVVDELRTSVDTAESERREASEQQKREAEEARERRETERQERARTRDQAAEKAAAGEPLTDPGAESTSAKSSSSSTNGRNSPANRSARGADRRSPSSGGGRRVPIIASPAAQSPISKTRFSGQGFDPPCRGKSHARGEKGGIQWVDLARWAG
jgi:hypothetical protein